MALHFLYYNFVRIHQTLKVTPAMAAGVTERLWEMQRRSGNDRGEGSHQLGRPTLGALSGDRFAVNDLSVPLSHCR
jgi:hypothetical protein